MLRFVNLCNCESAGPILDALPLTMHRRGRMYSVKAKIVNVHVNRLQMQRKLNGEKNPVA